MSATCFRCARAILGFERCCVHFIHKIYRNVDCVTLLASQTKLKQDTRRHSPQFVTLIAIAVAIIAIAPPSFHSCLSHHIDYLPHN